MASAEHSNICQQLKVGDLVKVLDLLKCNDYSETNYFNLGLRLGLSVNTIKTIEANHTDIGRRLSECLTKWLEKADDVQKTKSGPTVYSLVSVLRETEQHAAAEGIEKQYAVADGTEKNPACKIFAGFTSNQSLLTALPKMVLLLQSEKLIEEIMCIKKEEKILLNEISKAVYIDSKKLEVFATILLQYSATIEIGSTIMREFRKVFYCDESCTDLAKKDALSSSASKFKSMHMKFCSTFNKVELIIKEYPSLTQDKIKTTLLNYSEDLMPQLAQCQNIQAILELVRKYCSLNDIEMLKFFVMELNIDEAKVVIQEYSDVIEEFSKTELSKCLNEKFSDATPLQCERIAIVFDQKTDACTLDNVRILSANIFHKLSSPQNSRTIKLFLISDSNNFFTITCSFPLILSEQLITAALNNIDVLKENKVKRLTIGYCTVYEATETVDTPTLSYEKQLLSPSSGLSKQLMLSLSIQLINCKDEELKNKMHGVETMKNEISRQKSDETGQLLHQKVTEKETDDESNQAKNLLITESSQSTQEAFGTSFEPTVTKVHLEHNNEQPQKTSELYQEKTSPKDEKMKTKLQEMEKKLVEKENETKKLQKEVSLLSLKVQSLSSKVQKSDTERLEFEDKIYGFIEIHHPLLIKIVRTEQYTRLKNIKKLGYIYHNMSKATCSRYDQSIGMYYFAGKFVKTLKKRQPELNITDSDVLCVQIAALCYNLGHGPFSHIFEDFLKDSEIRASRSYWKGLPANVMMFEHMIDVNNLPFDEYLNEQDIKFIKELMTGINGPQAALREDKVFLYEIVVNRMSGLDVNRMDYTMRDAGVLGKRIYFKWRKFLNRICVKVCPDGKKHICANEDDLDTYNGFFGDRHTLFRELYFERKNRIVATMVNRILKKCGEAKFIRGPDGKRLSLIDAIKKMDTYSRLNDGILDVINETVDDSEVEKLIKFLRSSKLFIPIGYVKNCQLERGSQQLKEEIAEKVEGLEKDDIIVDTEKSGYEEAKDQFMYYVSSNGTVQKWIIEWQSPPAGTFPARWGVFYTKHDKEMVAKIKNGIQKVVQENGGNVDIFKNETDVDLIPVEDPGSSD
ncbi:PREDICTED: uncharacterized protein LOC105314677 [Amphimedon queenslandica]|uniref:Death domain-containing protein n=1 Tax=Amphimedon queenslandica TaxID=400682 RepID=A0AAN0IQ94_AMPQE|nr:PREDICTED: uncharacterized protein LOC105314677 [Amphimedon queenslandica]|eukprot:XP_011407286.2 PREDICTED: uncharacterized protein LOC105314677 [Amphimedon queenslandica]